MATQSIDSAINSETSSAVSIAGDVNTDGGDFIGRDKIIGYTIEQVTKLLDKISEGFQSRPFTGHCPYVGLSEFEEQDAEYFFGRNVLIADLIERVKTSRFVVIAGPSGSGKSSLARAGLFYALKHGSLPGSEKWLYTAFKPGRDPIEQISLAIARITKQPVDGDYIRKNGMTDISTLHKKIEALLSDQVSQRALILVDQFEELFTQSTSVQEQNALLNMLTYAATAEDGRVTVLVVLRSDFVPNFAQYPTLNNLMNHQFLQVAAMQPHELVQAIVLPALHVGLRIDPDLIAQIVNDMEGEPGALPLMQFALKDLFDTQQSQNNIVSLTLADYIRHGGLHKALQRHADNVFNALNDTEQHITREIFKHLIQLGQGTQDVRRIAFYNELVPNDMSVVSIHAVIQKLATARLITTSEQRDQYTITLAHEKLIEAWPWLQRLVSENREVIALQNQISENAQIWEKNGRDSSYLYTGARLALASEQIVKNKVLLNKLSDTFLTSGINAEKETQRRTRRIVQSVIAGLLIAVLVFAGLAGWALQSQQQAQKSEATAQAESTRAVNSELVAHAESTKAIEREKEARDSQALAKANEIEAKRQARKAISRSLAVSVKWFL